MDRLDMQNGAIDARQLRDISEGLWVRRYGDAPQRAFWTIRYECLRQAVEV